MDHCCFSSESEIGGQRVEARYALANWNKLPLNPTISAEYRFGLDNAVQDSGRVSLAYLA
ncbi:MAG: hypothetical protein C5B58_09305 [Acidobacteria bacterium]|nr:MAG: hypothetical protein C5B58_09305 [Acidobacteriota bacterium]